MEEGQYSHDSDHPYFGILSACINFCIHEWSLKKAFGSENKWQWWKMRRFLMWMRTRKKHHSIRSSVVTLKLNYFHEQLDLETSSSIFFFFNNFHDSTSLEYGLLFLKIMLCLLHRIVWCLVWLSRSVFLGPLISWSFSFNYLFI